MIEVVSLGPITISSTMGHTVHIPGGRVPTPIPDVLLPEARTAGCVPVDELSSIESGVPEDTSMDERIKAAIEELVAANNEAAFNTDGSPKVKAVRDIVGEQVSADQVRAVFDGMQD